MKYIKNFFMGFLGNSMVVFMQKELDLLVAINFLLFYTFFMLVATNMDLKKNYVIFLCALAAAIGAFCGYKTANLINDLLC